MAKTTRKTTTRKNAGATRRKSPRKVARKSAKASTARRTKRTKDPRGGLTAAGRAAFRKRDGSQLKPGVTKKRVADMTPQEMRRKGSWAVRFYGRAKLPPLIDKNGEPTRHALSAHAWGEPVPKTVAAARRIAAKGHRLLDRYERIQTKSAKTSSGRRKAPKKAGRKRTERKTSTARKRKAA